MTTTHGPAPLASRALLVILDGLRPDALDTAPMPALSSLARAGWSAVAQTVRPSVTVAALTSLATGVPPSVHGLTERGLPSLGALRRLRPLPAELRRHRRRSLVVTSQLPGPNRMLARSLLGLAGVDRFAAGGTHPAETAALAVRELRRRPADLGIVYLNQCDLAGHAHGWMSAPYLAAARALDAAVETLGSGLDDGATLLAFVADHGGGGVAPTDHDLPHPVNDAIPLVFAGAGAAGGPAGPASLLDVPPTLLRALGLPVPSSYAGRVLPLCVPEVVAAA